MKKIIMALMVLLALGASTCTSTTTENTFDETRSITVYTRDTTSGTRDAFFSGIDFDDAVSSNAELVTGYVEVDGNGSMITSVNNDIYGVGYISLASLATSGLKGLSFEGIEPTEANVLNGTYDLKRSFNYMIRSNWTNMDRQRQIIEAFVAYMGTLDGIAAIQNKSGIISATEDTPSWDDIKTNYPIANQDNSDITIYFGGSTSVESVARELSQEFSAKCGNFIPEHNHTGSGDAYKRTQGSEAAGGNKLHIGFASRDFKDTEPAAANTSGFICFDAVVVVVNSANTSVESILALEVKQIYQGTISNWSNLD
ncbi:MAG: substrate-binding domain-containing protein [Candidatus Izemoplasmatales bacterium]|nr:substrate-binding domain-containing protein [Candidatus Izemoplasmatales bacterium]